MTHIITRYFESVHQAEDVYRELVRIERFSPRILKLYRAPEGLAEALTGERVAPQTAEAYAERVKTSGAVLLVRAGIKPLAAAKTARTVTAAMGAVDMGNLPEEVEVPDGQIYGLSVLTDHPHMMTRPLDNEFPSNRMADWPIPLISRRKPFRGSVIEPHGRMASWPIGHLVPHDTRYGRFPFGLLAPHRVRYGRFPFGLLAPHDTRYGRFPFGLLAPHGTRYGKFPFGLLAPHGTRYGKFPFGLLTPRSWKHMANWPFPHLIGGKQGQNALAPHAKRFGRFPFGLLVPHAKRYGRFPFGLLAPHGTRYGKFPFGLLTPRSWKHMAKFPFAHIVPGHKHMAKFPFGHIVPGHKYMANWIFPHTKTGAS